MRAAERAARGHAWMHDPEHPFYGVVATRRRVARLHKPSAAPLVSEGHPESHVDYMSDEVQQLSRLTPTDLIFNTQARELLARIAIEEHWS